MKNGQITVEAILIIGFFLLFFVGISMPMAFNIYDSSTDASVILEMRTNLDAITRAIKTVRAGGPESVRTISMISNVKNLKISAYDSGILTYWVKWSTADDVPYELTKNSNWGGLSKESISGVSGSGASTDIEFSGNGEGKWNVKVKNSATSSSPTLSISSSLTDGDTIEISLTG